MPPLTKLLRSLFKHAKAGTNCRLASRRIRLERLEPRNLLAVILDVENPPLIRVPYSNEPSVSIFDVHDAVVAYDNDGDSFPGLIDRLHVLQFNDDVITESRATEVELDDTAHLTSLVLHEGHNLIQFTPVPGFTGMTTFTYVLTDQSITNPFPLFSDPITVMIEVYPNTSLNIDSPIDEGSGITLHDLDDIDDEVERHRTQAPGPLQYFWYIDANEEGDDPFAPGYAPSASDLAASGTGMTVGTVNVDWDNPTEGVVDLKSLGITDGLTNAIITLKVIDDHGFEAFASQYFDVAEVNPAPTTFELIPVTAGCDPSVELNATFSEPNLVENSFTVSIDWDFFDNDPSPSEPLTYTDNGDGTYTIDPVIHEYAAGFDYLPILTIVGEDPDEIFNIWGMTTATFDGSFLAKIREVNSTVELVAPDTGFIDTYTWSVTKDGQPFLSPALDDVDFSFVPADAGVYVVHLVEHVDGFPPEFVLTYDDTIIVTGGGSGTLTAAIVNDTSVPSEGYPVALRAEVTGGCGPAPTLNWSVNSGLYTGTGNSFSFTPIDNGTYSVELFDGATLLDSDTVIVGNLPPTATLSNNGPVNEASPATVSFNNPSDASSTDVSAGLHYSFALTASGLAGSYAAAIDLAARQFTFDDNGNYTVYARIFDKDGGSTDYMTSITVNNVAPSATFSGATDGVPGQLLSFSVVASDASTADLTAGLTKSINWGDGNVQTPGATPTHTYANVGTYTVTLTVTDKDAGSTTATHIVSVVHALQQGGSLFVGGGSGNDSMTLDHNSVGNVHVSINGAASGSFSGVALATVFGGEGTSGNSDSLTVNGTTGADVIHKGDGIITLGSPVAETINYSGISALVIDGREGNDAITDPGQDTTILGGPGDDTIIINATSGSGIVVNGGDGSDTYTIGGGNLGDLSGPVSITDTGTTGTDNVEILGTSDDDTITQLSTGFDLNGTAITFSAGLETATVSGGGGADEVVVSGTPPVPIEVEDVSDMVVIGTTGNDHIHFSPGLAAGEVIAKLNGVVVSQFRPDGKLVARGGNGDDTIHVAGGISRSAWLFGGADDDRLKGGAGHDILLGENGNDLLVGGHGRDILIGGDGQDGIHGNTEDDILISGIVDFGANLDAALSAIQAAWTNPVNNFCLRTAIIEGTAGNLAYHLNSSTVPDDGDKDILHGDQGIDWFFANLWLDCGEDSGTKDKIVDWSLFECLFANDLDFICED